MIDSDEPGALLRTIAAALASAGIRHMIVGSFASTFHGEPRTTQDLDLVIDPSGAQLEQLLAALDPERFYFDADVARDAHARRTMFNVIEIASAWKLDLMIRKDRAFSISELERREAATILGVEVNIATAEDVIVSKLEWAKASNSDRQLEDVAGILRVRGDALDRGYLDRWIEELELQLEWQHARMRA